jgi:hypothetical protein
MGNFRIELASKKCTSRKYKKRASKKVENIKTAKEIREDPETWLALSYLLDEKP